MLQTLLHICFYSNIIGSFSTPVFYKNYTKLLAGNLSMGAAGLNVHWPAGRTFWRAALPWTLSLRK
jgi:hypothetical protein